MQGGTHFQPQVPQSHDAYPGSDHAADIVKPKLSQSGARRLLGPACRSRWMRRPRGLFLLAGNRAGTYLDYIHDRMPLAVKLPSLLVINLQQQRDRMILPRILGVHRGATEPTARNRVQDAHQRALRVAIANVK